jgi:ABC-type transporter Mla MlaB component
VIFTSGEPDSSRAFLAGELDLITVGFLTNWADALVAESPPRAVRIDAAAIRFADVCGVRRLAEVCALLAGRCESVELTRLPEQLRRVATVAGIKLPGLRPDPSACQLADAQLTDAQLPDAQLP